eukprot:scaffold10548_cov27-Tisochrysis_lutea.AAC.1
MPRTTCTLLCSPTSAHALNSGAMVTLVAPSGAVAPVPDANCTTGAVSSSRPASDEALTASAVSGSCNGTAAPS